MKLTPATMFSSVMFNLILESTRDTVNEVLFDALFHLTSPE